MHLRRTQKKKAIDLFTVSDTIFVRGRGGGGGWDNHSKNYGKCIEFLPTLRVYNSARMLRILTETE